MDAGICYRLVTPCSEQRTPLIEAFTAPGDSGSWVIGTDPYPGVLYGSAVASSIGSQITYIIPGYRILLDVEKTFGNGSALLATEENIKNVDVDREEVTQLGLRDNSHVVLRQPHWIRALDSRWGNAPIRPSKGQYVRDEAEYDEGLNKSSHELVFSCCHCGYGYQIVACNPSCCNCAHHRCGRCGTWKVGKTREKSRH